MIIYKRILVLIAVILFSATNLLAQEICDDGIDNDGNGLIDLNDPACDCGGSTSLIPNPSFEDNSCCPTECSGDGSIFQNQDFLSDCADIWIQASDASSDYFNTCDYTGTSQLPFPDGNSAAGFIIYEENTAGTYLEYLGATLTSPLLNGVQYQLSFDIAFDFVDGTITSTANPLPANPSCPIDITIYGTPNAGDIPWAGQDCPVGSGSFVALGNIAYNPDATSGWGTLTITFTPTFDVYAVAIGGPCSIPIGCGYDGDMNNGEIPYFYVDNLMLNTPQVNISETGNMCTNDLVLTATSGGTGIGTYQWYYAGIAIPGQTNSTLNISTLGGVIGDYQVMFTSNGNCATDEITVTHNPVTITVSPDDALCLGENVNISANGGTTYTWDNGLGGGSNHNVSPTATTIYHVTASNVDGCSDSSSIEITVNPQPIMPNITGTLAICGGDSTMLDAGSGYGNYLWSTNETTQSIYVQTSGIYSVTVSTGWACTIDTQVTVVVSPALSYTTSMSPASCFDFNDGTAGIAVTGGIAPISYIWSNDSTSQSITNVSAGNYYFTITDTVGCSTGGLITVTQPTKVSVGVSPDITICISDTADLYAAATGGTAPYNYFWDSGQYTTDISVEPVITTTYTVYAEDFVGCISEPKSIIVNVRPPLSLDLDISDYYVCKGDPATIIAQGHGGNGNYTYTLDDGTIITPPYDLYTTSTIKEQIKLTLTDNCGTPSVFDTISVNILPLPEFTFQPNITSGCQPLPVQFNTYANSTYTYEWNFGDVQSNNNMSLEMNPNHTFDYDGIFSVTLIAKTDSHCINSLTVPNLIEVYKRPTSKFTYDKRIASIINPTIDFTNQSSGGYTYHWMFGDGDSSDVYSPLHTYPQATNIWYEINLIAISNHDCRDTSEQQIYIRDEYTFYAPTAFTPDNDGKNDEWMVFGNGIISKNFKLYIFDRWGEVIFFSDDPNKAWDGKVKGLGMGDTGLYTWKVYYLDKEELDHTEAGKLMLIR